jgi:hypothetical protein
VSYAIDARNLAIGASYVRDVTVYESVHPGALAQFRLAHVVTDPIGIWDVWGGTQTLDDTPGM